MYVISSFSRENKLLKKDMFIGEYTHNVDTKKRLALPSKFRGELGDRIVLTRGLDHCLFAYPMSVWETIAEKLGKLPLGNPETRSFVRLMLSGATDVELDGQGRVVIPEYLRLYAQVEKSVVVAGLYDRIEIWNEASWTSYRSGAEENTDAIAEKLGELGLY